MQGTRHDGRPRSGVDQHVRLLLDRLQSERAHGGRASRSKVTASPDYPVNRGKACPKGFQFLGHLDAPTGRRSRISATPTESSEPIDWDRALQLFVDRLKDLQRQYGPESVAFLSTGQMTSEEMAYLGALAKFGMGMRARRRQHAPVHGHGGRRLQAVVRLRRAAVHLRGLRGVGRDRASSARISASPTRSCGSGSCGTARQPRDHRHRSARDRDGDGRRRSTRAPAEVRPDALLRPGAPARSRGLDRPRLHRRSTRPASTTSRARRPPSTSRRVARGDRPRRRPDRAPRRDDPRGQSGSRSGGRWASTRATKAVRTAQAIINLALMTGNIGRPGTGAELDHRPVQRDGLAAVQQHDQPASAAATSRNAEHRAEVAAILGIDEARSRASRAWPTTRSSKAIERGQDQGPVDRLHQPGPLVARPQRARAGARESSISSSCRTCSRHRDGAAGRTSCCPRRLGREGRHLHQLRAADRASCGRCCDPPGQALPDCEIFQRIAEPGAARTFSESGRPRRRSFRHPEASLARETLRHLRHRGLRDAGAIGGVQWPLSGRLAAPRPGGAVVPRGQERRLFEDGGFFHADGRARFMFEDAADLPEAPDAEYPYVLLTGRGSVYQWHTLTRTDKRTAAQEGLARPGLRADQPARCGGAGHGRRSLVEVRRAAGR